MSQFEHKGIAITFNEQRATFSATINKKHISKPSLSAMKTAIDKSVESTFKPFSALIGATYSRQGDVAGGELTRVTVIGLRKHRKTSWQSHEFEYDFEGGGQHRKVMEDTPANIKAFLEAKRYEAESQRIESERREKLDKLKKNIKWLDADNHQEANHD